MENFITQQIKFGLKYIPGNLLKSVFIPKSSAETEAIRNREYICGVCHPSDDYKQITDANIRWVRVDIPFPFEKDGSLTESYENFKVRMNEFQKNGLKVMAITPYPLSFIEKGYDIRDAGGAKKVSDVARFLVKDLKGLVNGLQITNEMGMPHFTLPLNMTQAAEFIGVQLRAIAEDKGDMIVGYNSAGPQSDLHSKLEPYWQYCDYIGIDIYIGCFAGIGGFMWMFDMLLRYLWAMTGKPILLQEFGYISGGKPKTASEKKSILKSYGFSSEKEVKSNIEKFVEKLPRELNTHTKRVCENDPSRYFDLLFKSDITNHVYRELPAVTKIPGFDHTSEGQAKFYEKILPRLYNMEYMCGTIIYCYCDSDHCYICGQDDCPIETRWGLVDCDGNPKPSYYAVKKAYGDIIKK